MQLVVQAVHLIQAALLLRAAHPPGSIAGLLGLDATLIHRERTAVSLTSGGLCAFLCKGFVLEQKDNSKQLTVGKQSG